ncbi:MAG: SurA N-terminal domain-containing protein [Thermodesulfobacteriota bacterium]
MSLDLLRKRNSILTKALLVVIAVTFVIGFGFSYENFGFGGGVPQGTVADVNGEKISLTEFYRARDNLYRQYGQQGDMPEALTDFIEVSALNQLIDLKLLSQKASELGFRVTDEELGESIRTNPAFLIEEQFIGQEAYKIFIEQSTNQSVGQFEKRYREELLAQKLIDFINQTVKVTDGELYNSFRMQNEKVNLYFITFSPDNFLGSISLTREELKSYYEKNKSEFKTPELRSIRYITLSPEIFENRVNVSDEEIEAYYRAYKDEFKTEEQETLPLSEVKKDIRDKIKKQRGEYLRDDFLNKLDDTYLERPLDEISNENGVEKINEIKAFSIDENVEGIPLQVRKRAFSLNEGEKNNMLAGNTIWIIELSEIIPSRQKELSESEDRILDKIKFSKAKDQARLKSEELLKELNTNGKDIIKIAKSEGLEVNETGFFNRLGNVPKINSQDLKLDAFSLTEESPLGSEIYVSGDNFYIVSLKEFQRVDPNELEEKKAELREIEISQRRANLLQNWLQKLRNEAKIIANESIFSQQG